MRRLPYVAVGLFLLLSTTIQHTSGKDEEKPNGKAPEKAQGPINQVQGLKLPAPKEYDPGTDYTIIQAETEEGWKLEQVEFAVVNFGEKQVQFNELGTSLIVGMPGKGEVLFVYANALITKEVDDPANKGQKIKQFKMTKHAVTTLTIKDNGGGPAPVPGNGTPTAIPNGIRQISVIFVYPQGAKAEVKGLASSKAMNEALAKGESKFFPYEATADNIKMLDAKGLWKPIKDAGVPGILIVTADKRVLPQGKAIALPLGENAQRNEFILLDIVGRATGGTPGSK